MANQALKNDGMVWEGTEGLVQGRERKLTGREGTSKSMQRDINSRVRIRKCRGTTAAVSERVQWGGRSVSEGKRVSAVQQEVEAKQRELQQQGFSDDRGRWGFKLCAAQTKRIAVGTRTAAPLAAAPLAAASACCRLLRRKGRSRRMDSRLSRLHC